MRKILGIDYGDGIKLAWRMAPALRLVVRISALPCS